MRPIEEYLKPEVIQQVARLDLKAKFIVEGFISGLHDSPYYGFSSEFSEHRRYTIGDEVKNLDWNVFARTDKFYIKRFEAETNLDCHILLDASESMAYAHGRAVSKLEYSIYMAAALGYLMIHQQDNVGLITFDEELTRVVPARSKRSHLVAVLGVLAASMRHRPSRLAACLHRAADMLRKRGLVILMSDLIPAEGEDQAGRAGRAAAHQVPRARPDRLPGVGSRGADLPLQRAGAVPRRGEPVARPGGRRRRGRRLPPRDGGLRRPLPHRLRGRQRGLHTSGHGGEF